jgi:hypothetical protein
LILTFSTTQVRKAQNWTNSRTDVDLAQGSVQSNLTDGRFGLRDDPATHSHNNANASYDSHDNSHDRNETHNHYEIPADPMNFFQNADATFHNVHLGMLRCCLQFTTDVLPNQNQDLINLHPRTNILLKMP